MGPDYKLADRSGDVDTLTGRRKSASHTATVLDIGGSNVSHPAAIADYCSLLAAQRSRFCRRIAPEAVHGQIVLRLARSPVSGLRAVHLHRAGRGATGEGLARLPPDRSHHGQRA